VVTRAQKSSKIGICTSLKPDFYTSCFFLKIVRYGTDLLLFCMQNLVQFCNLLTTDITDIKTGICTSLKSDFYLRFCWPPSMKSTFFTFTLYTKVNYYFTRNLLYITFQAFIDVELEFASFCLWCLEKTYWQTSKELTFSCFLRKIYRLAESVNLYLCRPMYQFAACGPVTQLWQWEMSPSQEAPRPWYPVAHWEYFNFRTPEKSFVIGTVWTAGHTNGTLYKWLCIDQTYIINSKKEGGWNFSLHSYTGTLWWHNRPILGLLIFDDCCEIPETGSTVLAT